MIPVRAKKIIRNILDSGKRESERIEKEGKERSDEIISNAKKRAEEEKKSIIADHGKKIEDYRRRKLSEAKIGANNLITAAKSDMTDEIIDISIKNIPKKEYEDFLLSSVRKGIRTINSGGIKILASAKDINFLKGKFPDKKIEYEKIKTRGGCIVKSGKLSYNALFDDIISAKKDDIEMLISKRIFGDGNDP